MAMRGVRPRLVEPGDVSRVVPDEEPETERCEPENGGRTTSRATAFKEASAKGKDGPEEGTDYYGRAIPPSPASKKPQAIEEVELLAAMEAMKPLVAALGAEKVRIPVDLMG